MNKIFDKYIDLIAREYTRTGNLDAALKRYIKKLTDELYADIVKGVNAAWWRADKRNTRDENKWLKDFPELRDLNKKRLSQTMAVQLDLFIARKHGKLNLSERVWKVTEKLESDIRDVINTGLSEGMSAVRLARQLKQYLREPNKLFRRVRDSRGALRLSKAATLYRPGTGVYRSSVKNAQRLARTEINMAYRSADHERWKRSDVVVGIEIRLSNNHTTRNHRGEVVPLYDICDELAARYPVTFKFVGWHPHCRCNAVPIVKTMEERRRDYRLILEGKEPSPESVNRVVSVPPKFHEWIINNYDRVLRGSSVPYFIRDNFVQGNIRLGLKTA